MKSRGRKLGTMEGSVVFLVVVVMAVGVSGREQCTTDQHRQMQVRPQPNSEIFVNICEMFYANISEKFAYICRNYC